ncbi:hypothetical protein TWF694_002085 [Orbilia ellipsospora]|uniref:Uncharacterized protein n=1 Tax=Orbilia ellipsospora TaxID=2528407 RepID=A0AAV9XAP3_9PEZI
MSHSPNFDISIFSDPPPPSSPPLLPQNEVPNNETPPLAPNFQMITLPPVINTSLRDVTNFLPHVPGNDVPAVAPTPIQTITIDPPTNATRSSSGSSSESEICPFSDAMAIDINHLAVFDRLERD